MTWAIGDQRISWSGWSNCSNVYVALLCFVYSVPLYLFKFICIIYFRLTVIICIYDFYVMFIVYVCLSPLFFLIVNVDNMSDNKLDNKLKIDL